MATGRQEIAVKTMVLGELDTNCYLVYREGEKECVVIDPAANAGVIMQTVRTLGLRIGAILLTHGHFDHIGAVEPLRGEMHAPVYAGAAEKDLLAEEKLNLSQMFGTALSLTADVLLSDDQEIYVCGMHMQVIGTPGHTAGSVCYYLAEEGLLFAGDTLFAGSAGRTDFPTGDTSRLLHSLREKLALLPDETRVLSGHGGASTIGYEKMYNPYL